MTKKMLTAAAVLALAVPGLAQETPRGQASVTLGGKKVTVDYGRPSLKGRSFDELLSGLPADRMWRAGAAHVTTLTSETALLVGGRSLPAGKYSLYVHVPNGGDYALVLNRDPGVPLGEIWDKAPENMKKELWPRPDYGKITATEALRVPLHKSPPPAPADQFTIDLTPAKDGAVLALTWGDRRWTVDIKASAK